MENSIMYRKLIASATIILLLGTVVMAATLLSGCTNFAALPNQDRATDVVWKQTYDMIHDSPPSVQWITQGDLNCGADKTGRFLAFYKGRWYDDVSHSDTCVGGVTWPDWAVSQVALSDGLTFSTSAFAHELYHQSLNDRTGDVDPDHHDPGFGIAFGHPYGIVDAAKDALAAEGL